jgi:large subunit ribosomal protein L11
MPIIKLLVDGGAMKPGPAVAQQLGPMGINMGKVISDVNSATGEFKGMEVPVQLDVDPKTKSYSIKVMSPAVSALIKKELGVDLGERKKLQVGNFAIEQVISIAKQKKGNMLAGDFLGALKSVIGSCMSMGVLIETKDPKEILEEIDEGKYKEEIESQKTEVDAEKAKKLKADFAGISSAQKAVQEEEKKAAEEKKVAEENKEVPKK